jgi:membrane fusion protein, multidrug efflux system
MAFQVQKSTLFTILVLLLGSAGADAQGRDDPKPLFVRTMVASVPEPTLTRQFFGRVAAVDTINLAFEVGGRLEFLDAVAGSAIDKGHLIAALDQGAFERAVQRAELSLMQAERDLERAQSLMDRNIGSAVEEQNARTARNLAEVNLQDALAALADTRIVAPFDAVITDRIASRHTIITPGQPIVRLHDMSEIRVEFDLPERLVRQVGDPEEVEFVAFLPGDDQPIALAFREFSVETGPVGQSYSQSLAVVGETPSRLLPGQAIIVRGHVQNPETSLILPPGAIAVAPDGQTYVVIVESSGNRLVARHQPVEVSAPTGGVLRIEGLSAGTEVVAVGAHAVSDGALLARYTGLTGGSE